MRRREFALAVGAAALAISVLTGFARAQDVYVTYQINNWTLAPAIIGQNVKGFLAYSDPTSNTGSNISIVWYQREGNGSWTTWAWETHNLCGATLWVRAALNDNLVFENEPILSDAAWEGCAASAPKQVINGLFFDDPVQPLVQQSPEPQSLVTTLVDIGWQAAPDLSPLAVAELVVCDPNGHPIDPVQALMDVETYWTELRLFGISSIELLCNPVQCPGCERVYGSKLPAAGSAWVLHSRVTLSDGRTMCFFDRDAVMNWTETGLSYILCHQCTGSGQIRTTLHTTTYSSPGDSDCHPPP